MGLGKRQTVNCRKVKDFFFQENRMCSLVSPFWLVLHHFMNPSGLWFKYPRYCPLFTSWLNLMQCWWNCAVNIVWGRNNNSQNKFFLSKNIIQNNFLIKIFFVKTVLLNLDVDVDFQDFFQFTRLLSVVLNNIVVHLHCILIIMIYLITYCDHKKLILLPGCLWISVSLSPSLLRKMEVLDSRRQLKFRLCLLYLKRRCLLETGRLFQTGHLLFHFSILTSLKCPSCKLWTLKGVLITAGMLITSENIENGGVWFWGKWEGKAITRKRVPNWIVVLPQL